MASQKQGQGWLADRLGVSRARVVELVREGRIPRKTEYDADDVAAADADLVEGRAANNATAGNLDTAGDDVIESLSKNPEKIARIKLIIARTAKLTLERELLAGGYIQKEEAEKDRITRVFSVRAKLQELPLRASLIAGKSEAECERILSDWMKEACDYYANGGD